MTNNDVLRSLRYTFNFDDAEMISIFELAEHKVSRELVSQWLKKDDDQSFKECQGVELCIFLNGLINKNRGKKDGPQVEPQKWMNNNIIFKKLKIALDLKSDQVIEIMKLADFDISSHELSAFFRKKGHKNYRTCKDQILRNFLKGLQLKHRPEEEGSIDKNW